MVVLRPAHIAHMLHSIVDEASEQLTAWYVCRTFTELELKLNPCSVLDVSEAMPGLSQVVTAA